MLLTTVIGISEKLDQNMGKDYLGADQRKAAHKDDKEEKEIKVLDEGDIALMKTYGQGQYTKALKQVYSSLRSKVCITFIILHVRLRQISRKSPSESMNLPASRSLTLVLLPLHSGILQLTNRVYSQNNLYKLPDVPRLSMLTLMIQSK